MEVASPKTRPAREEATSSDLARGGTLKSLANRKHSDVIKLDAQVFHVLHGALDVYLVAIVAAVLCIQDD